ncbi:MAG: acylneuraminate cytidylyltransferase family protein [Candidatus Brocadia sp.]|nr:acylneuraminate cytidylyltransferase family protein [Candidatus Brocadia sp.]
MIAIIPARGSSVELPGKNIRPLCGKPLIAYTIEAALQSKIFHRVIVSTDYRKIADISASYGAEVPFMRPEELATHEAKSMDVVIHAIQWLEQNENYIPDIVTLLQPTSPFRDSQTIVEAYALFKEHNASRLVSLKESDDHYYWMYSLCDRYLRPVSSVFHTGHRRQDLSNIYSLNGAIYMGKRDILMREKSYLGPDTVGFVMSRQKSIDINDILDFSLAEVILEKGLLHV